jgi:hypothetical protein
MDQYDLDGSYSATGHRTLLAWTKSVKAQENTHSVGEVGHQVVHGHISWLDFRIEPTIDRKISVPILPPSNHMADHFVKVFCCTVTHCCSNKAISSIASWTD